MFTADPPEKALQGRLSFSKNDLDYQTWLDLGTLNDMLDSRMKIFGN